MKKFNIIGLLLAFVGVLSLASCEHPQADWAPGAQDENMGVYFPQTKNLVVTAEDTFVNIPVMRNNAAEEATVTLRYEDVSSCGFFTVPSSVKFAAGENEATLKVTFDGTKLTPGVEYGLLIKLDGEQASQYGVAEHIFKIGIAEPWISLGKGLYRDDFMSPLYGGPSGVVVEMEIFQHELETNRYRLIDPYSPAQLPYIIGGVPSDMTFTEERGYIEFVVVDETKVYIPSCPLGFKLDVGTGQPEDFFIASVYADENTPIYGEFTDGVFWFTQPESIMWHIPDGRGNYANYEGLFAVALPGHEIKDYAISAAYGGMVVEADNTTASAVINFAVGADVQSYQFTVLPGNVADATETIEAIVAGSEEIEVIKAKANELSWKVSLDGAGVYTVVAVPYGAEAVTKNAIAYAFYYPGLGGSTETPAAEIAVYFDSVAGITGKESYEEQFPEAYFAAAAIIANADEIKSVKMYVGREDVIVGSGLEREYIVANYGDDVTADVLAGLAANGSVVLGPFNLNTGSEVSAMFIFETLYGETRFLEAKHTLPNASGLDLGSYNFADGDYAQVMGLLGDTEPGYAYLCVDAYEFLGVINAEAKTVTFNGAEPNYNAYLFNQMAFYYDSAKTKAYGVWSCSDEALENACDLVLSFDENGTITSMDSYLALCIYNLADGTLVDYGFFFSPATTITKVQPEAAKASLKASAKSLNTELKMAKSEVSFVAEPCQAKRVLKSNAVLR